ncbi:TetR/AcrR family transcriptional regulator [Nocardioides panacisoli]|uniref:TetR/AcrR family transcriptional regulator n=1 Tax=Nocardioides panacisoli TaxID=627624 RepID=UPI001C6251FE|nr:TetR/AcrR family transcriptional regulator [Nocardioides panacisoli]QYJ02789.1 TetR/AcrR family transcriptional regulator [Nocardioides panacisoli]
MPRRREPLTRDRILDAAIAVADRDGRDALSMRNVGKQLGVEAMSLYHHVSGKEALLDAVVDRIFAGIALPEPDEDWREAMWRRASSARDQLAAHPWALGLIESRRTPGEALLRHHDAVLGSLRRGGFSVAGAAHAFSVIDAYVYGFVLTEANLPFEAPEEVGEVAGDLMAQLPQDAFPHLAEMVVEHALLPGYDYREEFGHGLELVLDGLARWR